MMAFILVKKILSFVVRVTIKRDYKILMQAKKDAEIFINNQAYKEYGYYRDIVDSIEFLD